MNIVSIHGSHNGAIAFNVGDKIYAIEMERFNGYKNSGIAQYKSIPHADIHIKQMCEYIKRRFGIESFDACVTSYSHCVNVINGESIYTKYEEFIPYKEPLHDLTHHYLHTVGTYYQSPYEKMVIISFDGGGNDGFFNGYVCESKKESPKLLFSAPYDMGGYMTFGHYLKPIRQEGGFDDGNLVYSGKLMGLCGYGKAREEWLPAFRDFYRTKVYTKNIQEKIAELSSKTGIQFDAHNRLEDQIAYDVAATSQKAFEDVFFEVTDEHFRKYPDYAIGMTGGCALNVLLNTEIKKRYNRPMYVPPNPSDCGLAAGAILHVLKPEKPAELIYAGMPLLDIDCISYYLYDHSYTCDIVDMPSVSELAKYICEGKILGVARGNAEHGPRALGNRSILCDPSFPDMKNVLNAKVKNREWYRPFAPVVRYEDANKYFEALQESPYMSFAFNVRKEYKEKLKSITHVDGTARVQTLRRETNPWLYDLIGEVEKINGVGVLLNTSFNVNAKPILSTIKEAFTVFDNTKLDGLIIENTLIKKRSHE
jgi:carbamoyltransferase